MTSTRQPTAPPHGCLDGDCTPCLDCGTTVHAAANCYAIDCGSVCVPCGQARYGDNSEHLLGPLRGYERQFRDRYIENLATEGKRS